MPLVRKPSPPGDVALPEAAPVDAGLLQTGTSDQRWTAARAVADRPDAVGLLGDALPVESDTRVREVMFTALSRIGTAEAAAAIVPCLRSDDASMRVGALDALHAMPTAAAGHLKDLLADSDADVRLLSCDLVRDQPEAEANQLLSDLLARETEANVCAAALEAIAEIGTRDVLPALERCKVRFAANPFLLFSIEAATARIAALPPATRV